MSQASLQNARRYGRRALHLTVAGLALVGSVQAQGQQTRAGVDVRVSGEVSSNPYLEEGADDITATANGELRPWLRFQGERTAVNLEGFAQVRQFADRYDTEDNYGANLGISHRSSERLMLTARAGAYSSASRLTSLLGQIGIDPGLGGGVGGGIGPLPNPIDFGDDVTVLGSRVRTVAFNAGVGAGITLSARNKLDLDTSVDDMSFNAAGAQDYRMYNNEARFTHVIDAGTSVGFVLGSQFTDYKDVAGGDARTYNAMASVSHRLGQYWTFDGSLGAAFTKIDASGPIPKQDFTSLSARGSLCRRDDRRSLCIDYSRRPQPTALGGVRNSDLFNLNANERISERDTLSVSGSYSRSSEAATTALAIPTTEFVSARVNFDRRFSQRVSGFVSGSVSKIYRSDLSVDPSISIGAGITVHLGQRR